MDKLVQHNKSGNGGSGNSGGNGSGKGKKKGKCNNCGEEGHWAQECPKDKDTGSGGSNNSNNTPPDPEKARIKKLIKDHKLPDNITDDMVVEVKDGNKVVATYCKKCKHHTTGAKMHSTKQHKTRAELAQQTNNGGGTPAASLAATTTDPIPTSAPSLFRTSGASYETPNADGYLCVSVDDLPWVSKGYGGQGF